MMDMSVTPNAKSRSLASLPASLPITTTMNWPSAPACMASTAATLRRSTAPMQMTGPTTSWP